MSQLLVLRLRQAITYRIAKGDVPDAAKDRIEIHRAAGVFDFTSPDGPEAALPGPGSLVLSAYVPELRPPSGETPKPELCPRSDGLSASELCPPSGESPAPEHCPPSNASSNEGAYILQAGSYLFRQEREGPGFDLRACLRDFVRDAWWERHEIGNELILRRVAEDGKTALQFLCRTAESPES